MLLGLDPMQEHDYVKKSDQLSKSLLEPERSETSVSDCSLRHKSRQGPL